MAKYSKAIAALVSAIVGMLVAVEVVQPGLAETLNEGTVQMLVNTVAGVITAIGVFASPANAE
tara:strand:+ start:354 stop:542 length:189 start_codon:yes stop_codon:yes gene_type:complete